MGKRRGEGAGGLIYVQVSEGRQEVGIMFISSFFFILCCC